MMKKNALRKEAIYRFRHLSWPYRPYSVLNKAIKPQPGYNPV